LQHGILLTIHLYVEGSSPNILERCDPRMRICEYLPAVNASRVQ